MNWSDFKKLEKEMIKGDDLNPIEKIFGVGIVAPVVFAIDRMDKKIEDISGKGLIDRGAELIAKEEEEKKNHYWRWAGKKILLGTIKGITGASVHK